MLALACVEVDGVIVSVARPRSEEIQGMAPSVSVVEEEESVR